MKPNLVILIDFSAYSETLLTTAKAWKNNYDINVIVLHKVPGIVPVLTDSSTRREIIEVEKRTSANRLKKLIGKYFSNQEGIKYHVTENPLIFSLPVFSHPEDIILAGLKGTNVLKNIFIGSTIKKLMAESGNIIIALPKNIHSPLPVKLIVSVNSKYKINEDALVRLQKFFNTIHEIEFISVTTKDAEKIKNINYLETLKNLFSAEIKTNIKIFTGSDVLAEIKNYVNENKNSLLVVQKGSRNFTDHLFRKFFIHELIYDGSLPLVILPA